jgi:hypothetical protein
MATKNTVSFRDREITSRRLILSVGSLLAKKGFKGLGVNAVAREMVETNELTEELERVREESIMTFFQLFFIRDAPGDVDLQALVMLVGAALSYLVIRSGSIDLYGGLDLATDQGWQKIESAVNLIIRRAVIPE